MNTNEGVLSEDIGGFKYRFFYLDPLEAMDLLADLGQILAPAIGAIGGPLLQSENPLQKALGVEVQSEDGDTDSMNRAIGEAVNAFFSRVTKEKQRELINILAKKTMVVMPDGKEPRLLDVFQTHFTGRTKCIYQWVKFALGAQYGDFFTGSAGDTVQSIVQKAQATA